MMKSNHLRESLYPNGLGKESSRIGSPREIFGLVTIR